MLDDWLGSDGVLSPLRDRIEARARGNPLFVEEMVRSLVERGVLRGERGLYRLAAPIDEIMLPETVQAVLASRIDRLAGRDKDVLQAAAVVGRDVPIELRAVVDLTETELAAPLERLSDAELLGMHGPAAAMHAGLLAYHFDEAGERLGFFVIEAKDMDEACAVAARFPPARVAASSAGLGYFVSTSSSCWTRVASCPRPQGVGSQDVPGTAGLCAEPVDTSKTLASGRWGLNRSTSGIPFISWSSASTSKRSMGAACSCANRRASSGCGPASRTV